MNSPWLQLDDVSVRRSGSSRALLDRIRLSIAPGEVVGLFGRSGAGKSTLLAAVTGLVPWVQAAEVTGAVHLQGEDVADLSPALRARNFGIALDRPEAQLFLATPRDELAAAARLHAPAPWLERAVFHLAIGPWLDRRSLELSSGERQRVALACAFAAAPKLVVLDEPTAHLDDNGVRGLAAMLAEVTAAGGGVLIAEQAGWRLGGAVSRWLELRDGRLHDAPAPHAPKFVAPPTASRTSPCLVARGIALRRGGALLFEELDLALHPGEVMLLCGPNGAGKSSLARALAGRLHPERGTIRCSDNARRAESHVALMLPDPACQLFTESVIKEVELAGADRRATARILARHRLTEVAARAPWTLSRGERQRLLHGALDVLRPAVMIVDEPAQGLDPLDLETLCDLIHRRAARGRAYLIVSHRADLASMAHRVVTLESGRLIERGHA